MGQKCMRDVLTLNELSGSSAERGIVCGHISEHQCEQNLGRHLWKDHTEYYACKLTASFLRNLSCRGSMFVHRMQNACSNKPQSFQYGNEATLLVYIRVAEGRLYPNVQHTHKSLAASQRYSSLIRHLVLVGCVFRQI